MKITLPKIEIEKKDMLAIEIIYEHAKKERLKILNFVRIYIGLLYESECHETQDNGFTILRKGMYSENIKIENTMTYNEYWRNYPSEEVKQIWGKFVGRKLRCRKIKSLRQAVEASQLEKAI